MKMLITMGLMFFILLFLFSANAVYSQDTNQIKACIEAKKQVASNEQEWSVTGRVTCPSGDVVGFPPRTRRHDRDGTVVYIAPAGYSIVNTRVEDIIISTISSVNGSHGNPTVENGIIVKVPIHCRGRDPGQGRAWHEIRVSGKIRKIISEEQIIQFTLECAQSQ